MVVLPPSPNYVGPLPHTGGEGNKPIRRIVIHCTAGEEPNEGAARRTVSWTRSHPEVVSSYHYCADSQETVQAVWDSVVAYHCGYNSNSIGYELSCSLDNSGEGHWRRADHQLMLRRAARDVAKLCLAYGVPITKLSVAELRDGQAGICGHVDIRDAFPGRTTHWDPGPFFPWRDFIEKVQAVADELSTDPATPTPPPVKKKPHDPFVIGLVPGRWDAPIEAWQRRHAEVRAAGAKIVTMTEATQSAKAAKFLDSLRLSGWETYHDPTPGPFEIIHSWDPHRFEMVGLPWKVELHQTTIWSHRGYKMPNRWSVGIALRDKLTNRTILLVGAHLPLENTARRRVAKEEALKTLKEEAFDAGRAQFPHGARVFACDWNKPAGSNKVRAWFHDLWPNLKASWATRQGARQGPDWVAVGGQLGFLEVKVLPRAKGDPIDHTTKVVRTGWLR